MRKVLIICFILINSLKIHSQIPGINNIWAMGYDCCAHPLFQGMNMQFSTDSVFVNTVQRYMNFHATNAQFFDENNNLLFLSNGIYVANALDDTMQNGSGLNPSLYTTARYNSGLLLIQGNLAIPFPGDTMKYYLFHNTIDDYQNTNAILYVYYSIIDMNLDGGLGAVVQKNTVLLTDSLTGGFTATKHANGRDWWVIKNKGNSGIVFKFLVTPDGIQTFSQDLIYGLSTPGQMVFTPSGDKLATYNPIIGDLEIWDFDRCSGMFSNYVQVLIDDSASVPGAAFSPSGKYLYLSSSGGGSAYVYQFDMDAVDIGLSKQIIADRDTFSADFSQSALGPDNRIYIVGGQRSFHVINYPDSAGAACGFCRSCIQLPAYNGFTVPNHPNYTLGPVQGSICDSLFTGIDNTTSVVEPFNVFPVPARDRLYVTHSGNQHVSSLSLYNAIGQKQIMDYTFLKNGEYIEINTTSLQSGIYFLEMNTGKRVVVKKVVVKQ